LAEPDRRLEAVLLASLALAASIVIVVFAATLWYVVRPSFSRTYCDRLGDRLGGGLEMADHERMSLLSEYSGLTPSRG
jgi:hypothetical protein